MTPNDLPSQKFAAKIMTRSNSHNRSDLKKEAQILNSLSFEEGFPRIQAFNIESKKEILIMSLLGQNLKTLHSQCLGKFSLKTVTLLAVQILKRLEALHSKGLLHRDIKPENVVMGSNRNDEGTAYLIDFGLSEPFLDSKGKHVPFSKNQKIGGTLYYLSAFGHLSIRATRRDDLISLGYMLVHLFKGELPWMKLPGDLPEKIKKMYHLKSCLNIEILCQGLPQEVCEYLNYSCNLPFNQKPKYEYLRGLFKKVLENMGAREDGHFDWMGIDINGIRINEEGLNKYRKNRELFDSFVESEFY